MLTLNDLHSQIDERLSINSIESQFSEELYTDLINASREVAIRNEYNKNRSIDPYVIQDLNCVELELADPIQCCPDIDFPTGCKILRTKLEIPNTIEFYFGKGIMNIGSPDITIPSIKLIEYSRVPFIGHGRTTYSRVYAFLYMKRLYLYSRDSSFLLLKRINIRGIFVDPTELGTFINCSGSACWSLNSPYPLNQWMWQTLVKPFVIQELLGKMDQNVDDANNAKDDKLERNGRGQKKRR
jgi:hypothetical protein